MSSRALQLYKRWLSPSLHTLSGVSGACRFQPTCSEYAVLAFHTHGRVRGTLLMMRRLLRCHPLCPGGFDPVPGTWPTQPVEEGALPRSTEPLHLP